MNTSEKENYENMEKNKDTMDEKVHYEIKFVETDDGYRLEASGDKEALKRLGIGPGMVGKRPGSRHGRFRRHRGSHRAAARGKMGRMRARRAAGRHAVRRRGRSGCSESAAGTHRHERRSWRNQDWRPNRGGSGFDSATWHW